MLFHIALYTSGFSVQLNVLFYYRNNGREEEHRTLGDYFVEYSGRIHLLLNVNKITDY